jgi:hypothetical protein
MIMIVDIERIFEVDPTTASDCKIRKMIRHRREKTLEKIKADKTGDYSYRWSVQRAQVIHSEETALVQE